VSINAKKLAHCPVPATLSGQSPASLCTSRRKGKIAARERKLIMVFEVGSVIKVYPGGRLSKTKNATRRP
jgi:hypothetical protein